MRRVDVPNTLWKKLHDDILADVPSSSGGSKPTKQVLTGSINGSNTVFVLPTAPATGTLLLFWNGVELEEGTGYTLAGTTITMASAPQVGDNLVAYA